MTWRVFRYTVQRKKRRETNLPSKKLHNKNNSVLQPADTVISFLMGIARCDCVCVCVGGGGGVKALGVGSWM